MTHALKIDTLTFSKRLRQAGADERLADAIVEGLTGADTSELATKIDIAEVRTEIAELRTEMKTDIAGVRTEIAELRTELKAEIAQTSNRTVYILGGLIGILIVIDRMLPLFGFPQ